MRIRLKQGLLLSFITPVASGAEVYPYFAVQTVTYTEPAPIKSILNDWEPPFFGGDMSFTYSKVEMGIQWREWQVGFFERDDYLLEFSPQTAELKYLTENRLPLTPGRRYELYLHSRHNRSNGIRLGRTVHPTPTLNIVVAISYLRSKAFTDGGLKGHAVSAAENDYDFEFDVNYHYSRDALFGRRVETPTGEGFSIDFSLDWQPTDRLSLRLDALDVASRIYWDAAPLTIATATSDTKTFDEQGYLRYDPVVSGLESFERFSQALLRNTTLAAKYRWKENLEGIVELQKFGNVHLTSVGAGWWYRGEHHFQGLYNLTTEGVILRYSIGHLNLELGVDHVQTNRMRLFDLKLSYRYAFQ